jgi:hypothetical protein
MPENSASKDPLVDWTRVLGGALAAVSSAVLLSTLGAVGTIAGAALGSIVVSVSSSVYAQGLHRSRRRMAQAQELALRRVGMAQAEVSRARRRGAGSAQAHLDRADENLDQARDQLESQSDAAPATETDREPEGGLTDEPEQEQEQDESLGRRLGALPWRRIALVAGLMFVIAVVAITVFELVAGRPVSSYTGGTHNDHGTSFSNLDHSRSGGHPSPSPSSPVSPSGSPSGSPSSSPSATPSGSPSTSPSAPTQTPSATPTTGAPAPTSPAATPSG